MKTFDAVLLRSELDSKIAEVSELRALVGELAEFLGDSAGTMHFEGCSPTCCICGLTELLARAEEATK